MLGAGLAAILNLLNNKLMLVGIPAFHGIPPTRNGIPGLPPHPAIAGSLSHSYYYGFLLHMISDAMLATSFILFSGVVAMTKSIRNVIRNWQCLQLNVELCEEDRGKEHLVPPVFSGHVLYAFSIMPRLATAVTCVILGLSAVVTAEAAYPAWPWPQPHPHHNWFLTFLDLSSLIVGFYMVWRSLRRLKHKYHPAKHDSFLKQNPEANRLISGLAHWWSVVGMMYVSEDQATRWRNK